mmetsp:Transcript_1033/g.2225  ORF Transcript_1033/g.2225 Transcript_1033/m.2225 type:complete len:857 (-) Transcript_1033:13-2583(-)
MNKSTSISGDCGANFGDGRSLLDNYAVKENKPSSQSNFEQQQETRDKLDESRYDRANIGTENRQNSNFPHNISDLAEIEPEINKLRKRFITCIGKRDEFTQIELIVSAHVSLEAQLTEAEAHFISLIKRGRRNEIDIKINSEVQDPISNAEDLSRFLSYYWTDLHKFGHHLGLHLSSHVSSVFFFLQNNTSGLKHIIQIVQAYEVAYKNNDSLYRASPEMNKATNIRPTVCSHLYQAFKRKSMEDFKIARYDFDSNTKTRNPSDLLPVKVALNSLTHLVSDMGDVISMLTECFPPDWHVHLLWGSCIGYVCSYQILRQVSQSTAEKFTRFNVSELLDLVGWVENFQTIIVNMFPAIENTDLDHRGFVRSRPALFYTKEAEVNEEAALASLAWVNAMFNEIRNLSQNEFLSRMQLQVDRWLLHVYENECIRYKSNVGRLTTSLCEDIFSLVSVQIGIIREHVTDGSEALVKALCMVFRQLKKKQVESRDKFLTDVETCSAAANDFSRMGDLCDEVMLLLQNECTFPNGSFSLVEHITAQLLLLFSTDAVYVAQYNCVIIFEPISEAISKDLFQKDWELILTENELILTLVRTIEDYLSDIILYLDESLMNKLMDTIVKYTVLFYLKCLLMKTSPHYDKKKESFLYPERALLRMFHDMRILKEFFNNFADRFPSIENTVAKEFSLLDTVYECLHVAAGLSKGSKRKSILLLLRKIEDVEYTKLVITDLWHLVAPHKERSLSQLILTLEEDMLLIMPEKNASTRVKEKRRKHNILDIRNVMSNEEGSSNDLRDNTKSILVIEERQKVSGTVLEDVLFEIYFSKDRKKNTRNVIKGRLEKSLFSISKFGTRVRSLSPGSY